MLNLQNNIWRLRGNLCTGKCSLKCFTLSQSQEQVSPQVNPREKLVICALYFNFKYFKKTQIRNKMVNKIKLKSKCFNLLCEYKNREHFDVILRGQMCTDQTQLKSGHTRKPQNQKPNYCCRLQFSFLTPNWLLPCHTKTFCKYFWCSRCSQFHTKHQNKCCMQNFLLQTFSLQKECLIQIF